MTGLAPRQGIWVYWRPPMPKAPSERPELELVRELDQHAERADRALGAGGPWRRFFAPGRANLMGAHLDYNGGPVMPTAIDRGTYLAVRRREDGIVRFASRLESEQVAFELDQLPGQAAGVWFDYPLGVLREFHRREFEEGRSGTAGVDVYFGGNLPIGAGLSSSASICVGFAMALDATFERARGPEAWVADALSAERGFVGVQCGIMDPFAVGQGRAGQLLWLDCLDRSFEHVPLDPGRVAIAVADSGARRELASGAFNQRVAQCEAALQALSGPATEVLGRAPKFLREIPREVARQELSGLEPLLQRRARHVFSELERTFAAREALRQDDPAGFGARMTEAHASLRVDFEVSTPELDLLVETAVSVPGVLGSRLTGAGFGGCTVILLERGAERDLADRLGREYERVTGRRPGMEFFAGDAGPRELA